MDKRNLYHFWMRVRPLKTGYLLAALAICAVVCILALRANNLHMGRLRQAVYMADQSNGDVQGALEALRGYVYAHMNTRLTVGDNSVYPPIQLKYTYERLRQAEQTRVNQASSLIYTEAQHYCEQKFPASFSGGPRVPCIEQYVKDHGVAARAIPDALYKFDFISPRWSPDLAGWSLVLCVFLALLALLRLLAGLWLRRVLE